MNTSDFFRPTYKKLLILVILIVLTNMIGYFIKPNSFLYFVRYILNPGYYIFVYPLKAVGLIDLRPSFLNTFANTISGLVTLFWRYALACSYVYWCSTRNKDSKNDA